MSGIQIGSGTAIEPLQILGSPDATVCEGEFCEIPAPAVE